MSGSFGHVWEYFSLEIWQPLAAFSSNDVAAPPDLFSDLFVAASDYLAPSPSDQDLEAARNDPEKAMELFLALRGADFSSETAIVQFLEDAHAVIADYEISGFGQHYRRLLTASLTKFNLRYRLDEPFIMRFLLPGSFSNLYAELHRLNSNNRHLTALLNDFEKAFDRYVRTQDPTDLKTCIGKVSNYAEGLASATYGTAGTLGALCDRLTDWPHEKVKEALKNLYKFCSDYPGIRHGGDPSGVLRDLAARDVTLASFLLLSYAGHLSPSLDERIVLGV